MACALAAAGLHVEDAPKAELFIDGLDVLRCLLFFDPTVPSALDGSLDGEVFLGRLGLVRNLLGTGRHKFVPLQDPTCGA
jgi:hypothetical protein